MMVKTFEQEQRRFVVFCYDVDEQRMIVDFAEITALRSCSDFETRREALGNYLDARDDYLVGGAAYTADELREIANELDNFEFC